MGSYTPQTPCAPRAARHPLRVCPAPRSLKYPRRKEVPPIDFCHIPVSIIKRSEGRSAVAAAAYRSGTKLTNEWDGQTHDYTRKGGVVHAEIMLPAHAPPEFADRSTLWNSVEQIEKARDSQLAREIEAALPRELSREQQLALVRAYDRILERCAPILFAGKNFREENAGATKQAAKDIVNRKHE